MGTFLPVIEAGTHIGKETIALPIELLVTNLNFRLYRTLAIEFHEVFPFR